MPVQPHAEEVGDGRRARRTMYDYRVKDPAIRAVISQQYEAQRALQQAGEAFDRAVAGLRTTLDAIAEAQHAQNEVINAIVRATQEALRLIETREQ